MNSKEIHKDFLNHQSDCYRSARYWAYREMAWSIVDHVCKLVIFITSAGAVCVKAIGGDPASVGWCAASALAAFVLESFAVQGRISFAIRQCQRYNAVLLLFPIDESEENIGLLKRIRNERLMVEKDETILLECLDVYCHNKQCLAENRQEDMWPMTRFQKTVGIIFPFSYKAYPNPASSPSSHPAPDGEAGREVLTEPFYLKNSHLQTTNQPKKEENKGNE